MVKDDWLMQLIRQSIRALHHVLGMIETDNLDGAEDSIAETAKEYTGLTWDQVESLPPEDLTAYLGRNEQAGVGQMILIADLLRASGIIAQKDENENRAYAQFLKALDIRLELAIGHNLSNAHLDSNVDELVDVFLGDYVLPTSTTLQLFTYFEKTTQYDKAENILYELLEDHITDGDMVADGLAFYERLLQQTDTVLATGNLTRAEVEEGFNELWAKTSGSG